MNKSLSLLVGLLVAASASAQGLRPEAVNGAVLGGIAGAVIGNNSGDLRHNGWRGAAIGAGTGLLLGQIVGDSRDYRSGTQVRVAAAPRTYVYRSSGGYHGHDRYYGYGGYGRPRSYGYYYRPGFYVDTDYYGYSGYDDGSYGRSNYAANGAVLGGIAGAIIGNNSGDLRHNGWRGAGLGAAAGFLLGSIAENNARHREAVLTQQAAVASTYPERVISRAPANAEPTSTVTTSPPPSSSAVSSANSLFGR